MRNKHTIVGLRIAAVLFGFSFFVVSQAQAAQSYKDILATMRARQAQLEELLQSPEHCLGEQLDGLLEINTNCSAEARALAEEENQDRKALHELMAKQLGISIEKIGEERAKKYIDRYMQGILREVRVSALETTWWDGYPPDPRQTTVSRVLALGTARVLHEQPDVDSPVKRDNVQQYEAFGVLDSKEDSRGERWYEVTDQHVPKIKPRPWSPKSLGWIAENQVILWRHAVAMRFTNPYHRESSLFFNSPNPMLDLMQEEEEVRTRKLLAVRQHVESGQGKASGVVAVEPSVGSKQEQMIMYPVLDFKRLSIGNPQTDARLLQVAARTRNGSSGSGNSTPAIDIIFVIDTTHSMESYFQNVLTAVEKFANEHTTDGPHFGLIGYQDKNIGYQDNGNKSTKEFTPHTLPASEFVDSLRNFTIDRNSERDDLYEAVFDGVQTALDSKQWRQESIKIIFLVGDTPNRENDKEEKNTTTILRDKAKIRNIALFAFHLRNTSESTQDLDNVSQRQYAELSSCEGSAETANVQPHMISIDVSSDQFRQVIANQFEQALGGFPDVQEYARTGKTLPPAERGSLKELIFQKATLMYADPTLPEHDITGWVCDKVLTDPDRTALTPMILLTANELRELATRVQELKDVGENANRGEGGTTENFFDLVSRNTKFTMVDPTAVKFSDAFSVPFGINELPYQSDIMNATRSDFSDPARVQKFIRSMDNKIKYYQYLLNKWGDKDVWKKLSANAQDNELVVGVELEQLP